MSTVVSNPITKKNPIERMTVRIDPYTYWDATNKRPTSGIFTVTITGITWTGPTVGGAESVYITIRHPNDHRDHNTKTEATYTASDGTVGVINLAHNIAWNYGVPDPSAAVEPDGTVDLLYIEWTPLNIADKNIASEITGSTITVTYTLAFTEYSPYSSAGGTALTSVLGVTDQRYGDSGLVYPTTLSGLTAVVVQLTSLATVVQDNDLKDESTPHFMVRTAPAYGPEAVLVDQDVSKASAGSVSFNDSYTWVFAVNSAKADANARRITTNQATFYGLLKADLWKPTPNDDNVTATLSYNLATH